MSQSCFGMAASRRSKRPRRWWCNCVDGLADTIRSGLARLRRARAVRWRAPGLGGRHRHRRSLAPVYVDELYSRPSSSSAHAVEPSATTSGKARSDASGATASSSSSRVVMSPSRGVLGVVKGMGEVDLRAELFIRKFREEMRLQSQRSAQELQEMLARGL